MTCTRVWPSANQAQNSSGLTLPVDHGCSPTDLFALPSIEQMELPELMMKNRFVHELHQHWMTASTTVIETAQVNNSLLKEIAELKAKLQRLKANEGCIHLFSTDRQESLKDSISPSDSMSHLARTPTLVLWNYSDLKNDPDIVLNPSNPNCPPMQAVICKEDGQLIDSVLRNRPKTMKFFKDTFRDAWNKVVRVYEAEQPLLALCSNNWKAEHMLSNILEQVKGGKKGSARLKGKSKAQDSSIADDLDADSEMLVPGSEEDVQESHTGGKCAQTGSSADQLATLPPKKPKSNKPSDGAMVPGPSAQSTNPPVSMAMVNSLLHLNREVATSSSAEKPSSGGIDVDFIIVGMSCTLSREFPQLQIVQDLLNSMKACPNFRPCETSADMTTFLERIEKADPNDTTINEDNKGVSWGHYQFTAGSMTCSSVMKSWYIGSTTTACKLIAAAICTCKVARYVCEKLQVTTASYISDTYLERVIETLWDLWKQAGAPTVTTTMQTSMPPESAGVLNPAKASHEADAASEPPKLATAHVLSSEELKERLESLVKEDLKRWIDEHKVVVKPTNKLRSKEDLISAILDDPTCQKPSQADVDTMKAARSSKRKPPAKRS
ncbi:hypothetical protein CPB84DRAFT_1792155 [Gymnopilus junonius]|uniref:Uncharacterized protein n=1 Tax=Gymnopilus junonius TaxID=109634 RepID=A0A9P5NER0_GYMJU|nr:hypothetical protein CPB84DRAFT_1792155 [Gymnopilus junonius]